MKKVDGNIAADGALGPGGGGPIDNALSQITDKINAIDSKIDGAETAAGGGGESRVVFNVQLGFSVAFSKHMTLFQRCNNVVSRSKQRSCAYWAKVELDLQLVSKISVDLKTLLVKRD